MNSKLENGRLIVNGLTGAMAGGRVNASGRIDVGDKQGAQSVRAQFDDVDLREVLRLLDVNLDSAGLSGVRADGIVNVNWRGTDRDLVRQSLSGSATIKTGPGRISKDSPLLKKLGNAAGISDLDGLSFRSARIEASADRGVLNIRSLVFQGDEFRLASAGVVNVRDSKINLLLDLDVTQALAERSKYYKLQGLASLFGKEGMETTEDGFVEVPRIALAGKLSEPDVKMDTGARSANRNEESVAKHSAPAKKPAEVEVEPVEEPSDSAREVAKQDAETETKRVPLWRDVLSSLTEEKK